MHGPTFLRIKNGNEHNIEQIRMGNKAAKWPSEAMAGSRTARTRNDLTLTTARTADFQLMMGPRSEIVQPGVCFDSGGHIYI